MLDSEEIENLIALLGSTDENNVKIAFEILNSEGYEDVKQTLLGDFINDMYSFMPDNNKKYKYSIDVSDEIHEAYDKSYKEYYKNVKKININQLTPELVYKDNYAHSFSGRYYWHSRGETAFYILHGFNPRFIFNPYSNMALDLGKIIIKDAN